MNWDKSLTFFEDVKAKHAGGEADVVAVKTGGADYARTFIAASIPQDCTGLTIEVKTGEEGALVKVAEKTATAQEIAAGVMAIPTPLELGKVTKVFATAISGLTEDSEKGVTCGITDAVPNAILMK